ncbi:MAG: hypothetical protein ACI4RG_04935 [Huintestinicola sp.]
MSANSIYKKDKAIIKEVIGKKNIALGVAYLIIEIFFSAEFIVALFLQQGEEIESLFGVRVMSQVLVVMGYTGCFITLNGTTPYGGLTNIGAAREQCKGSPTNLDTFMTIPVRRSSILRYQFEIVMVLQLLVSAVIIASSAYLVYSNGLFSTLMIILISELILMSVILFLSVYAVLFRSKAFNKVINIFTIAIPIIALAFMAVSYFAPIIFYGDSRLDAFMNALPFGIPGAVIASGIAAAIPAAMYVFYKKFALKKAAEVGWYE